MTTAPAPAQDQVLYGPDGQRIASSPAPAPAAREPRPALAGEWQPVSTMGNGTVWEKTTAPTPEAHTAPAPPSPSLAEQDRIKYQAAKVQFLEQQLAEIERKRNEDLERKRAAATRRADAPTQHKQDKKRLHLVDRFGPWVALYAAVGLTASGEYELAHLVGFPGLIAALLPTAIDVYVIQAMRRHRDVAAALILMVATNALFHLADAGLFGVTPDGKATWWLIVLVAAIAPIIVWRVHRITDTKTETETETAAPVTHAAQSTETTETSSPRSRPVETGLPSLPETTVFPQSRETAPQVETETTPTETRSRTAETTRTETSETKSRSRETGTRETETSRPAKPRETKTAQVSAIGDRETETQRLLTLMRSRGGEMTVSLDDAITETGRPKSTAAKRLSAARDLYLAETA